MVPGHHRRCSETPSTRPSAGPSRTDPAHSRMIGTSGRRWRWRRWVARPWVPAGARIPRRRPVDKAARFGRDANRSSPSASRSCRRSQHLAGGRRAAGRRTQGVRGADLCRRSRAPRRAPSAALRPLPYTASLCSSRGSDRSVKCRAAPSVGRRMWGDLAPPSQPGQHRQAPVRCHVLGRLIILRREQQEGPAASTDPPSPRSPGAPSPPGSASSGSCGTTSTRASPGPRTRARPRSGPSSRPPARRFGTRRGNGRRSAGSRPGWRNTLEAKAGGGVRDAGEDPKGGPAGRRAGAGAGIRRPTGRAAPVTSSGSATPPDRGRSGEPDGSAPTVPVRRPDPVDQHAASKRWWWWTTVPSSRIAWWCTVPVAYSGRCRSSWSDPSSWVDSSRPTGGTERTNPHRSSLAQQRPGRAQPPRQDLTTTSAAGPVTDRPGPAARAW